MTQTITQPKALAPTKFETELTEIDEGVQTQLPSTVSLTLGGTPMKQTAIDTQFGLDPLSWTV